MELGMTPEAICPFCGGDWHSWAMCPENRSRAIPGPAMPEPYRVAPGSRDDLQEGDCVWHPEYGRGWYLVPMRRERDQRLRITRIEYRTKCIVWFAQVQAYRVVEWTALKFNHCRRIR